jgi:hypothetical protein
MPRPCFLLYEQSQKERFGIQYDVMRDLLQEMIEAYKERGVDNCLEEDGESGLSEALVEGAGQMTIEEVCRAQANALLRRLDKLIMPLYVVPEFLLESSD